MAALVLGTSAAVCMTGCAGDKYHESTGEGIDDTAITGRVKHALSDDSMYKYPDVKVTTFKGTVQLSGFVDNRDHPTDLPLFRRSSGLHQCVSAGQIRRATGIRTCWISRSGSLAPYWPHEMTQIGRN